MAIQTGRIGSIEDAIQYDDTDYATAADFPGPVAIKAPTLPTHAAQAGSVILIGKANVTSDGGVGVYLTNKTGGVSVKGTIVVAATGLDSAVTTASADASDAFGVIAEDGIADGSDVLVVYAGRAGVLLEDNTFAARGNWVRTSPKTGGRVYAESTEPPGEAFADVLAVTLGTLTSGTVNDLHTEDGIRVVITEASGAGGGILSTLTFNNIYVVPQVLSLLGSRYNGSVAHTFNVNIYNNNTLVMDTLGSIPSGVSYADYEFDLGSTPEDYVSVGHQVIVEFNHASPGIDTHTASFDKVSLVSPDSEHFKEIGHCLSNNAGGINQLVYVMMHFL